MVAAKEQSFFIPFSFRNALNYIFKILVRHIERLLRPEAVAFKIQTVAIFKMILTDELNYFWLWLDCVLLYLDILLLTYDFSPVVDY
ncbi:hypothetical protein H5410_049470 [Solanum commersonii]|uniref:Uncharacterized protein n=1 Tax=Solanum commersonii TaxID=4109 RepID=A0A9J5WSG3_SOLCO|nr:hypothetical protein H5410_049470 [Solanum commersonii]